LNPGFPTTKTTALAMDNSREDPVYYVRTSGNGVYLSADGGSTWESMNDGLEHLNIRKLKIGDTFPKYLYAGTSNGGVWVILLEESSVIETEEFVSICQGESYEGHTESGEFQRILTSSAGSDSIVTTHLTVNPTFESEENVSICEGEEYLGLTEEGSHAREFETIHGCDSIVTTNLSFYPSFKPTFTVDGDTLTSNEIYSAYQWYDGGGAIAGATDRRLIMSDSGEYHLEGTSEHGCTYASDAQYVIKTYVEVYLSGEFKFSVIPNPNRGEFLFRIDSNPPHNLSVKLVNGIGQILEARIISNPLVNQTEQFNLSWLSAGVYHLVVTSDKSRYLCKIVIH